MIYADNAATTRMSDNAFKKMIPFLRDQYGNASSQYRLGVTAKRAVGQSREQVASAIGAKASEINFTSGGSESNSWVLRCVVDNYYNEPIHILTTAIEHKSVLNTCRSIENIGVDITYLPVDDKGRVSLDDVKKNVRCNTKLVSIMLANNEVGTIQPIANIGEFLNKKKILFHTDAVQAVGNICVNVNNLHVDFLTASAHKFNGPKGIGILYKHSKARLLPMVYGGSQEHGNRGGTENVAGIVAAGFAIEESVGEIAEKSKRLRKLAEETFQGIKDKIPSVKFNGDNDNGLPGIINLQFDGVSGESLVHLLDLKDICISNSSACNSGKDEPSHVLLALGLSEQEAKSSVRISYGKYNTLDDVKNIVSTICTLYNKIRSSL